MAVDVLTESDELVLSRYRDAGDSADFETIVGRYDRELRRYLLRYLGNAALADDVLQNTFLQVHLKRDFYQDGRLVRPWLYSIATHQAVDALRKRGRRPTVSLDRRLKSDANDGAGALLDLLASGEASPLAVLEADERRQQVVRCCERLPETLRETLRLAYVDRKRYREIAQIQDIPVGTVKSRLFAALKRLGQMLRVGDTEASDWVAAE